MTQNQPQQKDASFTQGKVNQMSILQLQEVIKDQERAMRRMQAKITDYEKDLAVKSCVIDEYTEAIDKLLFAANASRPADQKINSLEALTQEMLDFAESINPDEEDDGTQRAFDLAMQSVLKPSTDTD